MPENVFDLLDMNVDFAETAMIWHDNPITYAELRDAALNVANTLKERGIGQGDVVSLLFPNSPAFVATYFACWYLGAIANPLNSRLPAGELGPLINHAQSKLVVTGPTFVDTARESTDLSQMARKQHISSDPKGSSVSIWEFETEDLVVSAGEDRSTMGPGGNQPAALIYTSGTTSEPKGVLLSHTNLLSDARGISQRLGGGSRRTVCFMPLFHCNALIYSHLSTFCEGGSVVLLSKFSASGLWDDIERHGADNFSCPPTVLAMLLDRTPVDRPTPSSLRFVKVGAAPLPESLANAFERRFDISLVEGYGMTEATATTVMRDPELPRISGTVGPALNGQRIRIVDDTGSELSAHQIGDIEIAGDTIMLGYHRDPNRTSETVIDGWLSTGDIGCLEIDGNLRLTGRRKEIIIRGGENIFPSSLERILESHPGVIEGAVYGISDSIWGESPVAAVVPKPGLDLEQLAEFVRRRVADFEMPIEFRLMTEIPRNAIGKIQRHQLQRTHTHTHTRGIDLEKERQV